MDVLNFLGLLDAADPIQRRRKLWKRTLAMFCTAVLLLPSLVAFLMHLDNVEQALEALYYFSVQLLVNAQFWCVISDLKGFNELRRQVEMNVTSRTANGHGKAYSKADKIFTVLKKWIFVMFIITASFMLTAPLIITIYNYYTEDVMESSSWTLPFLLALPIPTANVPGYTFVYIFSGASLVSNMICKMGIQEIFIGTGFHLIASCHDIRDSLSAIDTIFERRNADDNNKNMKRSKMSYEVKRQLINIIKYHGEIINLLRRFSEAISAIIFYEFTINVVLLGSVGVFVTQGANIWNTEGTMVKFKLVCISAIVSLFISSLMGSEISYQQMEIAKYVYLTNWYAWPAEVRRFIPMILMNVRKRPIYGFGIVRCDLETFKETLNTVISVIIILKQME